MQWVTLELAEVQGLTCVTSVAATVWCWLQRHSKSPRGTFPVQDPVVPSKGVGVGLDGVPVQYRYMTE